MSGFLTGGAAGALFGGGMALLNGSDARGSQKAGATAGGGARAAGGSGTGRDPAAELSRTFERAIETQRKLQEVQITMQPFLDAAREKPR
ncbi:MAG: hypothetical protein ACOYOJ_00565 [Alsobacter sp.]